MNTHDIHNIPSSGGGASNAGEGPIYPLGNCARILQVVASQQEALERFPSTFEEFIAGLPESIASIDYKRLYELAQKNARIANTIETRADELQTALDVLSSCGFAVADLVAFESAQEGKAPFGSLPYYLVPPAHIMGKAARQRAVAQYIPNPEATRYDGPRYEDGEPLPEAFAKWCRARRGSTEPEEERLELVMYVPDGERGEEEDDGDWRTYFTRCFETAFDISHFADAYLKGTELEHVNDAQDVISMRRAFEFYPEAYEAIRDAFERTLDRQVKYHENNIRLYRGPLEGIEDIKYNSV